MRLSRWTNIHGLQNLYIQYLYYTMMKDLDSLLATLRSNSDGITAPIKFQSRPATAAYYTRTILK